MHKQIKRFQWGGNTIMPRISNQGFTLFNTQLPKTSTSFNTQSSDLFGQVLQGTINFNQAKQSAAKGTKTFDQMLGINQTNSGQMTSGTAPTSKNFMSTKGASMAGGILAGVYDAIPSLDTNINNTDSQMQNIRGEANKALLSGVAGPQGMLAGAINMGIDKTGGFTDASEGLGKGIDVGNAIASLALPGAGYFTKKTKDYSLSKELAGSTGYTGTVASGKNVQKNTNARLLFGASKQNRLTDEQQKKDSQVQDIMNKNREALIASNYSGISTRNQIRNTGGVKIGSVGANGMKIMQIEAQRILNLKKQKTNHVTAFKNGGTVNVIPTGALHAHKHNMDKLDDNYKHLTHKGIPVVVEEGNKLVQQAEIERNEIIFRLEVTEKLEKLMKADTDEAAIEAGKLLVYEILENTIDNTGLLKEIS